MRYLLPIIFLAVLFTGCVSQRAYTGANAGSAAEQRFFADDESTALPRKLIRSAWLELVAREPDSTVAKVVRLAEVYEGFMSESSSSGAKIRIPAHRLEEALAEISTYAKVKDQRLFGEDVTDQYYDMGIRLDNAEKSRQRYLELLARSETVEEILLAEKELERLTETIDLLKGRMNRIDQLYAYSTIDVRVNRKAKLGPLGYVVKGAYDVVAWLFVRG